MSDLHSKILAELVALDRARTDEVNDLTRLLALSQEHLLATRKELAEERRMRQGDPDQVAYRELEQGQSLRIERQAESILALQQALNRDGFWAKSQAREITGLQAKLTEYGRTIQQMNQDLANERDSSRNLAARLNHQSPTLRHREDQIADLQRKLIEVTERLKIANEAGPVEDQLRGELAKQKRRAEVAERLAENQMHQMHQMHQMQDRLKVAEKAVQELRGTRGWQRAQELEALLGEFDSKIAAALGDDDE